MQTFLSPALQELSFDFCAESLKISKGVSGPPVAFKVSAEGLLLFYGLQEPDIHMYASSMYIDDFDCACMSWELSANKIRSIDQSRHTNIFITVVTALNSAKNMAKIIAAKTSISLVVSVNIQTQIGNYETTPEDLKKMTAKEIVDNKDNKWWFDYELSFAKNRNCNCLPELDLSVGVWGKSLTPMRAVIFL